MRSYGESREQLNLKHGHVNRPAAFHLGNTFMLGRATPLNIDYSPGLAPHDRGSGDEEAEPSCIVTSLDCEGR